MIVDCKIIEEQVEISRQRRKILLYKLWKNIIVMVTYWIFVMT